MSVLYLALAIYIAGVATVLYVRPSIMFHPDNGTWKEFGLDSSNRNTIFPLWMFTIVWAFLSYAIASLGNVVVANVVLNSSPETQVATPISELRYTEAAPVSQVVHTEAPLTRVRAPRAPRIPAASATAAATTDMVTTAANAQLPGYYIVEPQPSGVPKFVYFGHSPPSFENLQSSD
jgi:hypothetical protein